MSNAESRIASIPLWAGPVTSAPLRGGLSNESFTVTEGDRKYVVRFCRDFPFHHVFREREVMATRAAHAAGFAPELVHAEPGIMVSRFIEGRTYDPEDVRDHIARIARLVRRFHTEMPRHVSGPGFSFWVFHVIRDYARTLAAERHRLTHRLEEFLALADALEAVQTPLPITYGHHDFLAANFIDDGDRLWLIDFEYAGFSTPMFDLANMASNNQFTHEQSEALLAHYFDRVPDRDLMRSEAAMQCASLLREAMWSMVSELFLDAPGVDYVAYSGEQLQRLDRALEAYRSRYG